MSSYTQYHKDYYNNNKYKPSFKASVKKSIDKYLKANPAYKLYHTAKQRAFKKGLEFSIDVEDIIIPTHCKYLGIELTYTQNQGRVQSNYSLDRIDSTKGYVKGNVEVISDLANRMKQEATKEQLIAFAKGILANAY